VSQGLALETCAKDQDKRCLAYEKQDGRMRVC